jgi:hypothetical protein
VVVVVVVIVVVAVVAAAAAGGGGGQGIVAKWIAVGFSSTMVATGTTPPLQQGGPLLAN